MLEQRRGIEAVGEHAGEAAERLQGADLVHVGTQHRGLDGAAGLQGERQGGFALGKQAVEQGVQQFAAHRFGEHVGDTEEIGILLPLPFLVGGIDEDGAVGRERFHILNQAHRARIGQLDVQNGRIDAAPGKEKLRLTDGLLGD